MSGSIGAGLDEWDLGGFGGGGADLGLLGGNVNPNEYPSPFSTQPPSPPGSDVNPNLYSDPNATVPSATPGSGKPANPADDTQPVTARIADALGKLSKASDTSHNPAPVQAGLGLHPASPQSSAFRGQNTLTNLMQLLMQRQQQYGPPGSSVAGGGRGLLGV
jgi:hypothetical protein